MLLPEREKLFATIARKGFEKDLYTHDEVFDDIRKSPFSLKEAAEYLEVAEITVRRWAKAGKLDYKRIGKNFVFDPDGKKGVLRCCVSCLIHYATMKLKLFEKYITQ